MSEEHAHEQEGDDEIVVEEIDGTVAEETTVVEDAGATTAVVAVRPASNAVLMPLDHAQVIEGMKAYQGLLKDLLEPSDWQDGGDKKFVKKSGWRKIARAFNLSVTKVSAKVERDADGNPLRAEVVYRATAPNGQVQDGDGYCSASESRFSKAGGRQKLENDLRATATTRAKNRAISDLVGMGEVSAEEVERGGGGGLALADAKLCERTSTALCWLLPVEEAEIVWNKIAADYDGKMPKAVADALLVAIGARKLLDEPPEEKADETGKEEKTK